MTHAANGKRVFNGTLPVILIMAISLRVPAPCSINAG